VFQGKFSTPFANANRVEHIRCRGMLLGKPWGSCLGVDVDGLAKDESNRRRGGTLKNAVPDLIECNVQNLPENLREVGRDLKLEHAHERTLGERSQRVPVIAVAVNPCRNGGRKCT
jgi:hypothetical protein